MKRLGVYLKPYTLQSILGPLFKLLEALLELFVPLVVADIIDTGIASGDSGYLLRRCLLHHRFLLVKIPPLHVLPEFEAAAKCRQFSDQRL